MRITGSATSVSSNLNILPNSVNQIAEFINLSPDEHRKIAELICSISDRMGKEGTDLLVKFVEAVKKGELKEFSTYCAQKQIPISIISDLLAVHQEMEAHTREKLDALVLKAKRGAIRLSKQVLQKAVLLLV
jgi:hypothetical protein